MVPDKPSFLYRCINVPVVNVSAVYGCIYYAYYVTKRDEYLRMPAVGIE